MLAGVLSPLGLLGYLRFCKLCNTTRRHLFQLAILFYSLLYFLYDVNNDVNNADDDDVNTFL